jgi:hypothetical protein
MRWLVAQSYKRSFEESDSIIEMADGIGSKGWLACKSMSRMALISASGLSGALREVGDAVVLEWGQQREDFVAGDRGARPVATTADNHGVGYTGAALAATACV